LKVSGLVAVVGEHRYVAPGCRQPLDGRRRTRLREHGGSRRRLVLPADDPPRFIERFIEFPPAVEHSHEHLSLDLRLSSTAHRAGDCGNPIPVMNDDRHQRMRWPSPRHQKSRTPFVKGEKRAAVVENDPSVGFQDPGPERVEDALD
jgi:hypothetical protein